MARRPSFTFYPGDWLSNLKLRKCTFEERGVWLEVLCWMHDSDEYGILRVELEEIATYVRCGVCILESLHRKGVLKGAPMGASCDEYIHIDKYKKSHVLLPKQNGPIFYSSRMLLDAYRQRLGKKFGKKRWKRHPMGTLSGSPIGKSASSSSTSVEEDSGGLELPPATSSSYEEAKSRLRAKTEIDFGSERLRLRFAKDGLDAMVYSEQDELIRLEMKRSENGK